MITSLSYILYISYIHLNRFIFIYCYRVTFYFIYISHSRKMKFFWASESKRAYSLHLLYLVWILISRKICFLDSALTVLNSNASETSEIKTSHFLTSFILSSLHCNNLLCHNFSSLKISLQHLTSELYATVEPLYL